jgi:hypothetical protein
MHQVWIILVIATGNFVWGIAALLYGRLKDARRNPPAGGLGMASKPGLDRNS